MKRTLLGLVILVMAAASAGADQIEINIETRLVPAQAVGIFLYGGGATQVSGVKTERLAENLLIASVPLPSSLPQDAMVTAMVVDADGKTAYGNVCPARDLSDSFYNIPPCEAEKLSNLTLGNQISVLEQLVDVRAQRRGNAQLKVTQALSGDFLARLKALEKSFGLPNDPELAPDMRPAELIDRLTRLQAAIQTLEASVRPLSGKKPRR